MGMSAAQARLLSITTRLNNNEFRSQTITNSKLRLADKSSEASQEYMNALNSQKLVYSYFDDNGESNQINMTAGMVYTYSPLKNQYALMNSAGKMLVSSKDAENFEQSNNLIEFLEKYGLVKNSSAYEKYQEDNRIYEDKKNYYDEVEWPAYLDLKKQWDNYDEQMKILESKPDVYSIFMDTVKPKGGSLLFCYDEALNKGNSGCYLHLLNHLIDFNGSSVDWTGKSYTASNGVNFTPNNSFLGGMGVAAQLKDVSDALNDTDFIRYCDGDDDFNTPNEPDSKGQNLIQSAIDAGRVPTELEILRSDYKYDEATNSVTGLKTLKEKAIDLYYIIQNGLVTDKDKMKEMLQNFTEGDMKMLTPIPPEKPLVKPVEPREPVAPLYETILNDKDKGQWYVNLWHMMNGSDTANIVNTYDNIYVDENDSKNNVTETIFVVENADRNPLTKNYDIFDDNLINNSEWLQFALEHGIITLAKAEFFDPSSDSGKTPELTSRAITWKSTIFTNAVDFKYVDDDVAIAIAEVKYKNAMREIENQDKKYDQDLKKLDTEHSAMTTEYESIKEAMNKNVERSFKAFS